MPVNANGFNTRITSNFLEKRFRSQFPAQAGAELIQDLYASGVIQPVVSVNADLPEYLQGAWDPGQYQKRVISGNSIEILSSSPGFYKLLITITGKVQAAAITARLGGRRPAIPVDFWFLEYNMEGSTAASPRPFFLTYPIQYYFLEPGGSLRAQTTDDNINLQVGWQKIAEVDGTIINPINFL